jgi:hypothetical protein
VVKFFMGLIKLGIWHLWNFGTLVLEFHTFRSALWREQTAPRFEKPAGLSILPARAAQWGVFFTHFFTHFFTIQGTPKLDCWLL